jgi:hypothetical protein
MARGIGQHVPNTSGQGVSRYSYAKGYQLGNRGTGGLADFKVGTHDLPQKRGYGKQAKADKSSDNYGDYGTDPLPLPPPKSAVPDKRSKPKPYPKGK